MEITRRAVVATALCLLLATGLRAEATDSTEAVFFRVGALRNQIALYIEDIVNADLPTSEHAVINDLMDAAFRFTSAARHACIHIVCFEAGQRSAFFACSGLEISTVRMTADRKLLNEAMARTTNAYVLQQAMEIKKLMDKIEADIAPYRPKDCTDFWEEEDEG
jgi:hypothetical protein